MLRAIFTQQGDPREVLKLEQVSASDTPDNHVKVDVLSTPIHNSDLLQVQGMYGTSPQLPAVPGGEGVGRIAELGQGVGHLAVGQTVLITGGNTWASQVVVPAQQLIPMPDGVDLDQLSMLVTNPGSALLMLTEFVSLAEGDWIIQSAANSAVGSWVVQLAKLRGLKTINVVRRENVFVQLEALGADVVLLDGPDLAERVAAANGGAAVKLALDAVGGDTFSRLVSTLAPKGTMVSYSSADAEPTKIMPIDLIFKGISLRGFWLSEWFRCATQEAKQLLLGTLAGHVASGQLHTKIDSVFPLSQLDQAVTRAMTEGRNGKVILHPQS